MEKQSPQTTEVSRTKTETASATASLENKECEVHCQMYWVGTKHIAEYGLKEYLSGKQGFSAFEIVVQDSAVKKSKVFQS